MRQKFLGLHLILYFRIRFLPSNVTTFNLKISHFMEIQGKIIAALDVKTGVSARGEWKVQEFVLETLDGQFSRKMVFSVFGEDRLQRFNIQVGQDVNVSFDIDAREYNGRWFNSIRAFDVRPVSQVAAVPGAPTAPPFATAPMGAPQAAPMQPGHPLQPGQPIPPAQPGGAPYGAPMGDSADDLPF